MIRRFAFAVLAVSLSSAALVGCDGGEEPTSEEQDATSAKAGKFETFKGIDGQHYFHLLASNGEKVLQSEGYSSRAKADTGIEAVRDSGVDADAFEILDSSNGEHYFVLTAENGEIIATSQLYTTAASAKKGRDTVVTLVANAQRLRAAEDGGASFGLITGTDSKTYFHLRAANGEIVLQSQGYSSKSAAKTGISSVRTNGKEEESFEIVEIDDGAFFRLKAANGQVIGRSEIFVSVDNAERGADTVRELLASELVADPK
jgi:uncharacterized protein YegP (UPF0339 family)